MIRKALTYRSNRRRAQKEARLKLLQDKRAKKSK